MNFFGKKRIFMDYAGGKSNPSGIHKEGREARRKLEETRGRVAHLLACQTRDIIFTSGSTESNNLTVFGVCEPGTHLIIGKNEHPSVLEPARELERRGVELTLTNEPLKHIKENTVLVSVSYAESETGRLNDVAKLARSVRAWRQKSGRAYPYFHTDTTQAYEYLEVDINKIPADLITLERVLVVRPTVKIRPLLWGGGQERGLRSGTEPVHEICKFVSELEDSVRKREALHERLSKLKEVFLSHVRNLPGIVVNTPKESLPNIVSTSFPGKLHEFLAIELDERGVAVSTGSSCASSKDEPDKEALRFSFGVDTSERDVREVARILKEIVI